MMKFGYKKKKAAKEFVVNEKSLTKAQSNLDKLRPLSAEINIEVSKVPGFACILLSKKILVLCYTDIAVRQIKELVKPHAKLVDVKLLEKESRKPTLGKAGPAHINV